MIGAALKVGLVLAATQPTVYEVRSGAELVREIRVEQKSVTVKFRDATINGFVECFAEARNMFEIPFDPTRAPRYVATVSTWLNSHPEFGVMLGGAVVKSYDQRIADDRGETLGQCGEQCVVMPARLEITCN